MSKKINIILIICLLGSFLVPEQSFACEANAKEVAVNEKSCDIAQTQHHLENENKDECCKTQDDVSDECSHHCGTSTCHGSSNNFSATSPFSTNTQNHLSFDANKSYPQYQQRYYSSGEFSIWQPPKIS